jgi:hypothetical protein
VRSATTQNMTALPMPVLRLLIKRYDAIVKLTFHREAVGPTGLSAPDQTGTPPLEASHL